MRLWDTFAGLECPWEESRFWSIQVGCLLPNFLYVFKSFLFFFPSEWIVLIYLSQQLIGQADQKNLQGQRN